MKSVESSWGETSGMPPVLDVTAVEVGAPLTGCRSVPLFVFCSLSGFLGSGRTWLADIGFDESHRGRGDRVA